MYKLMLLFMVLFWILLGIIMMFCQRKIVIYDEISNEIIAIIKPLMLSNQVTKKDVGVRIKHGEVMIKGNPKTGKIYLYEEEK